MILTFSKPEFERKILEGTKIHTLREDPKNRWRYGLSIQFYLGNPRNGGRCFLDLGNPHITIQPVEITQCSKGGIVVFVENRALNKSEVAQLALNDGFESMESFRDYFLAGKTGSWIGKIISWTGHGYEKEVAND